MDAVLIVVDTTNNNNKEFIYCYLHYLQNRLGTLQYQQVTNPF